MATHLHANAGFTLNLLVAIILTGCLRMVSGLQCYQCEIQPLNINNSSRLCVNFDGSEKYVVECPYSTMCVKQSFQLPLLNGESVKGVQRDCAPQKHKYQEYEPTEHKWHERTDIQEPYAEGCHTLDDKGARSLPTQYCYCRRNLCNSSPSVTTAKEYNHHTDAMAVILVFNAMKYLKSVQL